jgi:hypothetical protein
MTMQYFVIRWQAFINDFDGFNKPAGLKHWCKGNQFY